MNEIEQHIFAAAYVADMDRQATACVGGTGKPPPDAKAAIKAAKSAVEAYRAAAS